MPIVHLYTELKHAEHVTQDRDVELAAPGDGAAFHCARSFRNVGLKSPVVPVFCVTPALTVSASRIRPNRIRPNSRVRSHIVAAKPRQMVPRNTQTPPVALCRPELASR